MAFSLMFFLGARNFRRVSSPWRQLAMASSICPASYSSKPSFLHFIPKSRATLSPSMSITIRPRAFSFCFLSSSITFCALLMRASYSSWRRFASLRPPSSRRRRMRRSSVSVSGCWISSEKGSPVSLASSFILNNSTSTILYCRTGATSRFTSMGQSSSNSITSSRPLLWSMTCLYCSSQTFLRLVQHCSLLSSIFAQGYRAASFQNSCPCIARPRFLLCRGSVRIL
mmetsp:Transcript_25996/g.54998  ORF Transcript_25996/g.54998 Transcript_25996/m.54998 type:complete len:227 (+) Transcript_25996:925-1605(+)